MPTDLSVERTSLEAGVKKSVYKELRANPYLLGLSAVGRYGFIHVNTH